MNPVIKDIIAEASGKLKRTVLQPENKFYEGVLARHEVDAERVAELMIEECIRNLESNGYDDAADSIKQHFGEEK
jgi:hypothetical protein